MSHALLLVVFAAGVAVGSLGSLAVIRLVQGGARQDDGTLEA